MNIDNAKFDMYNMEFIVLKIVACKGKKSQGKFYLLVLYRQVVI